MTLTPELKQRYSVADFMALPDDGKRYELVEGELIEMPGPSFRHGRIISKLSRYMEEFLESSKAGFIVSGTAFILDPEKNTARVPDIAFVAKARLAGVDLDAAFPGPPDLAIEVVSPTDIWSEVVAKAHQYQTAGARLVWVIDPFDHNVFVYRPNRPKVLLDQDAQLDGEDILPGFQLPVKAIFEESAAAV